MLQRSRSPPVLVWLPEPREMEPLSREAQEGFCNDWAAAADRRAIVETDAGLSSTIPVYKLQVARPDGHHA